MPSVFSTVKRAADDLPRQLVQPRAICVFCVHRLLICDKILASRGCQQMVTEVLRSHAPEFAVAGRKENRSPRSPAAQPHGNLIQTYIDQPTVRSVGAQQCARWALNLACFPARHSRPRGCPQAARKPRPHTPVPHPEIPSPPLASLLAGNSDHRSTDAAAHRGLSERPHAKRRGTRQAGNRSRPQKEGKHRASDQPHAKRRPRRAPVADLLAQRRAVMRAVKAARRRSAPPRISPRQHAPTQSGATGPPESGGNHLRRHRRRV